MKINSGEQGSILLLVTGIVLIIGIVAVFLFYRFESEWAREVGFENRDQCRQIAVAVLHENLALLRKNEPNRDYNAPDDAWYHKGRYEENRANPSGRSESQITVVINAEDSKLNLNLLKESALKILLGAASPDPVLDWRDLDNNARAAGAETDYYQNCKPPYQARNGLFATVTELKRLKNGGLLYLTLSPEVTIYGKVNPNCQLDYDVFAGLLIAAGFDTDIAENMATNYVASKNEFTSYDDFQSLTLFSLNGVKMDKLKRVFNFTGNYNINFMSKLGLQALLRQITLNKKSDLLVDEIIASRPFKSMDELNSFFDSKQTYNLNSGTAAYYFTVKTTIIRYRIWVVKGLRKTYLETVVRRTPAQLSGQWEIHFLAWLELANDAVPAVPVAPKDSAEAQATQK